MSTMVYRSNFKCDAVWQLDMESTHHTSVGTMAALMAFKSKDSYFDSESQSTGDERFLIIEVLHFQENFRPLMLVLTL